MFDPGMSYGDWVIDAIVCSFILAFVAMVVCNAAALTLGTVKAIARHRSHHHSRVS